MMPDPTAKMPGADPATTGSTADASTGSPTTVARGFRFDALGRETLRDLSRWLSIAGYASFVACVAGLISVWFARKPFAAVSALVFATANALIGAMFLRAGGDFRGASSRPDGEHDFVMAGLRKLETYYSIQKVLLVALVVLCGIGFVVALVLILRSVS